MVDRQPYTFDRVIRILFGVVSVSYTHLTLPTKLEV